MSFGPSPSRAVSCRSSSTGNFILSAARAASALPAKPPVENEQVVEAAPAVPLGPAKQHDVDPELSADLAGHSFHGRSRGSRRRHFERSSGRRGAVRIGGLRRPRRARLPLVECHQAVKARTLEPRLPPLVDAARGDRLSQLGVPVDLRHADSRSRSGPSCSSCPCRP